MSKRSSAVKDGPPRLHRAQKFSLERVARAQLHGAPYNPRVIDPVARKKLERNLRKVGLVEPIVVNKRTMNIVSGHQRLMCLDSIAEGEGYELDVAMVELTDKQEREQSAFMNNASAMGVFDADLLATALEGQSYEEAGFEVMDLELIFSPEQFERVVGRPALLESEENKTPEQNTAEEEARRIAHVKDVKKQMADSTEDPEFYAVIVFADRAGREDFVSSLGYELDTKYIDGQRLMECLPDSTKA